MDEATARYPSDIYKCIELEDNLNEKYKNELAQKYGLTREELDAIALEGVSNLWPMP